MSPHGRTQGTRRPRTRKTIRLAPTSVPPPPMRLGCRWRTSADHLTQLPRVASLSLRLPSRSCHPQQNGWAYDKLTKITNSRAPSISNNLPNMANLKMWSYAPMPSTLGIVIEGSLSVAARSMWPHNLCPPSLTERTGRENILPGTLSQIAWQGSWQQDRPTWLPCQPPTSATFWWYSQ